jgi:hypothetical protein
LSKGSRCPTLVPCRSPRRATPGVVTFRSPTRSWATARSTSSTTPAPSPMSSSCGRCRTFRAASLHASRRSAG